MKHALCIALLALTATTTIFAAEPQTTQSVAQDIVNNEKRFEIDAGYGNNWIPVGPTKGVNMVRLEMAYFPMALRYYNLFLGFDGAYNFFTSSQATEGQQKRVVDFSATPLLRYYIGGTGVGTHAYTEAGVGVSYLTSTQLASSNFGTHFAFQLLAGAGVRFNKPLYAINMGWRFMHWSNGQLGSSNLGINIPLFFYIGFEV